MRKAMTVRKEYRFDEETEKALKRSVKEINAVTNNKITESEYLRDLIRRDRMNKMGVDLSSLADIQRQLRGIGINVNQIAHHLNSGLYDMYDIDNLKQCLNDISEIKEWVARLFYGEKAGD